jgi:hypothetical protein
MLPRRLPLTAARLALAALVTALLLPAGALASDASLRTTLTEQAPGFARDARTVQRLATSLGDNPSDARIDRLQRAVSRLRARTLRFRAAIAGQRADTASVARGRTEMLSGLRTYGQGLLTLNRALETAQDDGPSAAMRQLQRSIRLLRRAAAPIARGTRLIMGTA